MARFQRIPPAPDLLALDPRVSPGEVRELAHRLRSQALRWGWVELVSAARTLERKALAPEGREALDRVRALLAGPPPPPPVVAHLGVHPLPPLPGIPVVRVESGEALLALLNREPVGLLLLEVILPLEDGRTILAGIREHPLHSDLPVLALEYVGDAAVPDLLMLGVGDVLTEPVEGEAILREIRRRFPLDETPLPEVRPRHPPGLLTRAEFRRRTARAGAAPEAGERREPLTLGRLSLDRFSSLLEARGTAGMMTFLEALAREAVPTFDGLPTTLWETGSFMTLLPDSPEGARDRLDGVREALSARSIAGVQPTLSGAVVPLDPDPDLDRAILAARQAIFEVRMAGGGAVVIPGGAGPTELPPRPPTHLLVVDDDDITATIVRHRFEREGFQVRHLRNGSVAAEALATEPPDILVLDWHLPGLDGIEILGRIRRQAPTAALPVIMLTGRAREEDLARAFSAGADDYMLKPFSPVELLARCRRLLSWSDRSGARAS